MQRRIAAVWFGYACVPLVACGGKLIDAGPRVDAGASSAGAAAGGSPSAGANGGGAGSSNAGSDAGPPDADAPCPEEGSSALCATSCAAAEELVLPGECVNGSWRCPAPFVDPTACPPDACVLQAHDCCDRRLGKRSLPPCAANGRFAACPAGLERDAKLCVADSAGTSDCTTLFDKSCTVYGALCETNGTHCQCGAGDGGLAWTCLVDLL